MHYKDGTEAMIGDRVRGRGYNVKHDIIGTVVGLSPGSTSCNIQVAHVIAFEMTGEQYPDHRLYQQHGVIGCSADAHKSGNVRVGAHVSLEYGQCDAFELLFRDPEAKPEPKLESAKP